MRLLVALALGVALVGVGCASDDGVSTGDGRTYYEGLELSSPRAGAETFVDAFTADDFLTVFLTLDLGAQDAVRSHLSLLQYRQLLDVDAMVDYRDEIIPIMSLDSLESPDTWHLFDQIMLVADRNDAFLIDLSKPIKLEATEPSDVRPEFEDVLAEFDGVDGPVVLRMRESPTGRWRVAQVVAPGGDETLFPWSVPATGS